MPTTIWITGASGLIGNYLFRSAPEFFPDTRVVGLTRYLLDLTNFANVRELFQRQQPSLVVHCAALSKSPACQAEPALARKLNVDVTKLLAELAAEIPLIFFSTDLVFDGRKGNYSESDPVHPLSIYAETKVAAEQVILSNPRHTVVRTSLNGGVSAAGDRGFNEEIRQAWLEDRTLDLFTDEFRSPIPAKVTARAVWELARSQQTGLYHLAGSQRLSRWEIGQLLARRYTDLTARLTPSSLREYRGAARSPDTSLNSAKVQKLLSFSLPGLGDWLAANPQELF